MKRLSGHQEIVVLQSSASCKLDSRDHEQSQLTYFYRGHEAKIKNLRLALEVLYQFHLSKVNCNPVQYLGTLFIKTYKEPLCFFILSEKS